MYEEISQLRFNAEQIWNDQKRKRDFLQNVFKRTSLHEAPYELAVCCVMYLFHCIASSSKVYPRRSWGRCTSKANSLLLTCISAGSRNLSRLHKTIHCISLLWKCSNLILRNEMEYFFPKISNCLMFRAL